MIFLLAFLQRVLSGVQSYFGYSKNKNMLYVVTVIMMLYPLLFHTNTILLIAFLIVNAIVLFMKMVSFDRLTFTAFNKYKDIHLWENLVTGGYVVYLALLAFNIKSLVLIYCSVYPALILHKGLINLGSNQKFFDSATDDPTGQTYGIPLLNIKIKRSSTRFRIIVAIISLIVASLIFII